MWDCCSLLAGADRDGCCDFAGGMMCSDRRLVVQDCRACLLCTFIQVLDLPRGTGLPADDLMPQGLSPPVCQDAQPFRSGVCAVTRLGKLEKRLTNRGRRMAASHTHADRRTGHRRPRTLGFWVRTVVLGCRRVEQARRPLDAFRNASDRQMATCRRPSTTVCVRAGAAPPATAGRPRWSSVARVARVSGSQSNWRVSTVRMGCALCRPGEHAHA